MRGLKIRVQPGAIFATTFRTLGANPVAIDLTEVYLALSQRVRRHLRVQVWGPEEARIAHLTQGNCALGRYDARRGEEVVTKRRRLAGAAGPVSLSYLRATKGFRWPHESRAD